MCWSEVRQVVSATFRPWDYMVDGESTWRHPGRGQVNSQVTEPAHCSVAADDFVSQLLDLAT